MIPNIEATLQEATAPFTFNNLCALITAAGLEYTLQGQRPVTLFAPPDRAFGTFQHRTPFDLLKDITKLSELLQHHIVPLKLTIADLRNAASAVSGEGQDHASMNQIQIPTASGQLLTITLDEALMVEGIRILEPDIEAENGVVHIVENILWPPGFSEESFGERSPLSFRQQ